MNVLKLFGFNAPKKKNVRHIESMREFESILHRETARANRRNAKLSLILIDRTDKVFGYLEGVAYERLRLSDEIGWHTPDKLGILLPDTDHDGAKNLIGSLDDELAKKHNTRMTYTIYNYPSPDWPASI